MGRLATDNRRRGGGAGDGAAHGRALSAGGTTRSRRAGARTPAACCCLLLLLLALVPAAASRAQSGRKNEAPAAQGKQGVARAAQTPTPAPAPRLGPIAEPPLVEKKKKGAPTAPRPQSTPRPDAEEVDDDEVVSISSNLVPLPASVVDAKGRAVAGLKLEDFELRVDGEVRPIGDLSHAQTPVSIALLFDNSSSLNAFREFEREAGVRFLKSVVRPVDRAAVYSISTEPELSHPLTNDVRALVRTVENFPKPDRAATALFDTVVAAADYLKPQRTRKVIVIISDGTDTVSDLDFDTTLARLIADDCQVYAVQTGNSDSPNLHDLAGAHRLREFAAQTGGAVYVPRTHAELNDAFKQIATDLAQQYVLSYYPSGDARDGRFRAFTLQVKTRPDLRVRTRKGYYAPKG